MSDQTEQAGQGVSALLEIIADGMPMHSAADDDGPADPPVEAPTGKPPRPHHRRAPQCQVEGCGADSEFFGGPTTGDRICDRRASFRCARHTRFGYQPAERLLMRPWQQDLPPAVIKAIRRADR